MGVETEPIHFTQDDHHSIHERPTHDAPIGSRTPAATGEDDPRKEWKVLVTFSVTPVPMEHSSDLRAENKVLTVARLVFDAVELTDYCSTALVQACARSILLTGTSSIIEVFSRGSGRATCVSCVEVLCRVGLHTRLHEL